MGQVKKSWKWIAGGSLVALGAGLLIAGKRRRQGVKLVIVQDGAFPGIEEIQDVGLQLAARLGVPVNLANSGTRVKEILARQAPRSLDLVLFVGHGATRALLSHMIPGELSTEELARILAPRLTPGFVVSLNSCRTGGDPEEENWVNAYTSGGARSFAAKLRDALLDAGAPEGEIRAHHSTGIHGNPSGRVFYVAPGTRGTIGVSLREQKWADLGTDAAWGRQVQGELAFQWITGGDFELPPEGV